MIIDCIWRLLPYFLLSSFVWVLVVNVAVVIGSLSVGLNGSAGFNGWVWVRLIISAAACGAVCLWISRRHAEPGVSQRHADQERPRE